jgi:hypothetical protein
MSLVDQVYPEGFDFLNPNYGPLFKARLDWYALLDEDIDFRNEMMQHYARNTVDWIEDFCITYDPRAANDPNNASIMPMVLFERQKDFIRWLDDRFTARQRAARDGMCEKTRDAGVSWCCVCFAVHKWLFRNSVAIGFGSLKEKDVDCPGNPKALLEKVRWILRYLPPWMLPLRYDERKHATYLKIRNPENDATIVGEGGANIGRGGRTSIYFKDESAHYQQAESIEAALSANSDVKIDVSSVNGMGNPFHRKRTSFPEEQIFIFDWTQDPRKSREWFEAEKRKFEASGLLWIFAQEYERDYGASVSGLFIPHAWVMAAVEYESSGDTGRRRAALDIADEDGEDTNAYGVVEGIKLLDDSIQEWNGQDVIYTAHTALLNCMEYNVHEFAFDRIGVGAGVHAEMKRKNEEKELNFLVEGFVAGATAYQDNAYYEDTEYLNSELFDDCKAQAWWALRRRCEKTYKHVRGEAEYEEHELIDLPNNQKLIEELCRPKRMPGVKGLIKVEDKKSMRARGLSSPNLADMVAMLYAPITFEEELRLGCD